MLIPIKIDKLPECCREKYLLYQDLIRAMLTKRDIKAKQIHLIGSNPPYKIEGLFLILDETTFQFFEEYRMRYNIVTAKTEKGRLGVMIAGRERTEIYGAVMSFIQEYEDVLRGVEYVKSGKNKELSEKYQNIQFPSNKRED
jgi:hypothetical protein